VRDQCPRARDADQQRLAGSLVLTQGSFAAEYGRKCENGEGKGCMRAFDRSAGVRRGAHGTIDLRGIGTVVTAENHKKTEVAHAGTELGRFEWHIS